MYLRSILTLVLLALTTTTPLACSSVAELHREVLRPEAAKQDSDPISGEWDVTFHVHDTTAPEQSLRAPTPYDFLQLSSAA